MEEDIQNYSPTVMFRGTPCSMLTNNVLNPEPFETNYFF